MLPAEHEQERIRLHVGIHAGYIRIEKDPEQGLMACKHDRGKLKPLPDFRQEIKVAQLVFEYLSGPLLHDLNRISILLEIWEGRTPPVLYRELRERIRVMQAWIVQHGGKP